MSAEHQEDRAEVVRLLRQLGVSYARISVALGYAGKHGNGKRDVELWVAGRARRCRYAPAAIEALAQLQLQESPVAVGIPPVAAAATAAAATAAAGAPGPAELDALRRQVHAQGAGLAAALTNQAEEMRVNFAAVDEAALVVLKNTINGRDGAVTREAVVAAQREAAPAARPKSVYECDVCMEPLDAAGRKPVLCMACGNSLCIWCHDRVAACPMCRATVDRNRRPVVNVALMHALGC